MMNGKSPPKVLVRFAGKHIFHIERVISGGIVGINYVIFELAAQPEFSHTKYQFPAHHCDAV